MIIRILLADDNAAFRRCLGDILDRQPGLAVVGQAESGQQAVAAMQSCASGSAPDLVLLDVEMPGLGGPEAARELRALNPRVPLLALSSYDDAAFVEAMLAAGANGYVCKDDPLSELVHAIREVAAGRRHLGSAATAALRLYRPQSPHLPD